MQTKKSGLLYWNQLFYHFKTLIGSTKAFVEFGNPWYWVSLWGIESLASKFVCVWGTQPEIYSITLEEYSNQTRIIQKISFSNLLNLLICAIQE